MFRKSRTEAMARIKAEWEARKQPVGHGHVWQVPRDLPLRLVCTCGAVKTVED